MKQYICAESRDDAHIRHIIEVESDLPSQDLTQAVRRAVHDFLVSNHKDRDRALECLSDGFNWGDVGLWLPEEFTTPHGFTILQSRVTDIIVDFDEDLRQIPDQNRKE